LTEVKALASRGGNMTLSEREDLYSAMRTLVKLADAPAEDHELLFNTIQNSPASRHGCQGGKRTHANLLVLSDESDEGIEIAVKACQEEEERLSAMLPNTKRRGISFVEGDVSEDCAVVKKPDDKAQELAVSTSPRRATKTESFSHYSGAARGASKRAPDWHKNRDLVDRKIRHCRIYKALAALSGTTAACLQHELVMRGYPPQEMLVNVCKGLNLALSAILVALIYREHWLNEIFERIRLHLRLLVPLDLNINLALILSKPIFWIESFVCFVHLPPWISFEVGVINWSNFVLYRAETIFMLWNTLRVYLFWKCFTDAVLEKLPRRHTVSSFTGVRMNSAFTFKQVLNSEQSVLVIAMFWFGQILLLGYWFRAVEATACLFGVESGTTGGIMYVKPTAEHPGCQEDNSFRWKVWILDGFFDKVNDVYLWNSMWTMFSSSTSVGTCSLWHLPRVSKCRSLQKLIVFMFSRLWGRAGHYASWSVCRRSQQRDWHCHGCYADLLLYAQLAFHAGRRERNPDD